jgi:uncharacterized protein (TIGR00661 family)
MNNKLFEMFFILAPLKEYLHILDCNTKNILVAPLNWGIGHASRCVPIIRELEKNGYTPLLASDGHSLELLRKEFPHLTVLTLPSYHIEYAKNAGDFKWKLIKNSPKILKAIVSEHRIVKKWITEYAIQGIISDNRLGIYHSSVPSVYITHQLRVFSGKTTWLSTVLHQHFIKKFRVCWVPDFEEKPNLSGKLGHLKDSELTVVKYVGPLSRLTKMDLPQHYQLMVLLSGPEPQRTLLEEIVMREITNFKGRVVFVKGVIEKEQKIEQVGEVTYYNFMTSAEIENSINSSEIVLCRSGYTTVMDLTKLQKSAFYIPTPGQYEQEYLAKKLKRAGIAPYAKQHRFRIENLLEVALYTNQHQSFFEPEWSNLFEVFE